MVVRPHLRNIVLTGAVGGAVALAGCGTTAAPGSGQHGSRSAEQAKVSLTFTVIDPGHPRQHWTLRCEPPGGSQPNPARACRVLLGMKHPFAPPRKHLMCPMIMLSNQTIMVTGTWFGQPVKRVVVDGGCDLTIFEKIMQVMR